MNQQPMKQGDKVFANGYVGAFVRDYSEGMVEIRLPGGVACIPRCDMQPVDSKPGMYYVTVIDGARVGRLLGPFKNDHAAALSMVDKVRAKAEELDPRAAFYAFGTCRIPGDDTVPIRAGLLNKFFGRAE